MNEQKLNGAITDVSTVAQACRVIRRTPLDYLLARENVVRAAANLASLLEKEAETLRDKPDRIRSSRAARAAFFRETSAEIRGLYRKGQPLLEQPPAFITAWCYWVADAAIEGRLTKTIAWNVTL